jgi:alginate O-acetyltransferase complex protein AlgI
VVFSSPTFLFAFLPLTLALYFAVRGMAARNAVLLTLSLVFYAWGEPVMAPIMLGSIGFNYLAAIAIDRHDGRARAVVLAIAVSVNLLALGLFKYAGLVTDTLKALGLGVMRAQVALPLGISFFWPPLVCGAAGGCGRRRCT